MYAIPNFEGIEAWEAEIYRERQDGRARLIGLVFCRPDRPLAKTEIFPCLSYWNFRSGTRTAFYFAGYQDELFKDPEISYVPIKGPDEGKWLWSAKYFDTFLKQVERRTRWEYSGECDMILATSRPGAEFQAQIDFSSALLVTLDDLRKSSDLHSVSRFFEEVFRYAENQNNDDPSFGLSDHLGMRIVKKGIWHSLLELVPKFLRSDVETAKRFAVRDIGKRST